MRILNKNFYSEGLLNKMVNRERKMISVEQTSADLDGLTLSKAIQALKELVCLYGAEATLEEVTDMYSESDRTDMKVFVMKPETDEQMAHRIRMEEKYEAAQESRDREDFERLQKKFGK